MADDSSHTLTAREVLGLFSQATPKELAALVERFAEDPRRQVASAVDSARRRLAKLEIERERVDRLYAFQNELGGCGTVIGVDEVGRGAVAGPLTVAAVVLPRVPHIMGLNDSKQLTPQRREAVAQEIAKVAVAIGLAHVEAASIDAVGMACALRMAMSQAIRDTGVEPDCVLIDGNPVHVHEREVTVVKGDARVAAIAAASIVAKVTRDALMVSFDSVYPGYHLAESKGYASPDHIAAIAKLGLTPIHRATFCGNFLETPTLF